MEQLLFDYTAAVRKVDNLKKDLKQAEFELKECEARVKSAWTNMSRSDRNTFKSVKKQIRKRIAAHALSRGLNPGDVWTKAYKMLKERTGYNVWSVAMVPGKSHLELIDDAKVVSALFTVTNKICMES